MKLYGQKEVYYFYWRNMCVCLYVICVCDCVCSWSMYRCTFDRLEGVVRVCVICLRWTSGYVLPVLSGDNCRQNIGLPHILSAPIPILRCARPHHCGAGCHHDHNPTSTSPPASSVTSGTTKPRAALPSISAAARCPCRNQNSLIPNPCTAIINIRRPLLYADAGFCAVYC